MTISVRSFLKYSIAVALIAFVFTSCKKQETLVGKNLVPGGDYINGIFTDTLKINAHTIREDSISSQSLAQYVVGSMNDNVFGKSYAGVYTQVILGNAGISFNDTATVDSVFLILSLKGFYGDSTAANNLRVFRVTDSMGGTGIRSNRTFAYDPTPIGTRQNVKVNKISLNTKYTDFDGVDYGSVIRIPINNAIGQEILNQDGDSALKDIPSFLKFFKGLYIDADTASGFSNSMIYFNLKTDASSLSVYYHTPNTSKKVIRFKTTQGINTNYYKHNYQGKIVETALANATPKVDSAVYIQSMAGTKTWITFPNLSGIGKAIINKAELEITMLPANNADTSLYPEPARMELAVADSLYRNAQSADEVYSNYTGLPFFGGTKYYFTDSTGRKYLRYKFSIAMHLQEMLDGATLNNGFYLLTFPSNQIADRIIIGGANRNNDSYQMRLNLVYTKIP